MPDDLLADRAGRRVPRGSPAATEVVLRSMPRLMALVAAALLAGGGAAPYPAAASDDGGRAAAGGELRAVQAGRWLRLFNGRNLRGWIPKIRGHEPGENFARTFRVANGVLQVSYAGYDAFGDRFGYLFYKKPFSHYRLRFEYRFVGAQVAGGPAFAFRNSGVMLHSQPPRTMTLDQAFPVSLEVQLLGGEDTGERSTANLCALGIDVVVKGQVNTAPCTPSTSKTYRGDAWVGVEVEVRGGKTIRHFVDGEEVMSYASPQLDPDSPDVQSLLAKRPHRREVVTRGWIALRVLRK